MMRLMALLALVSLAAPSQGARPPVSGSALGEDLVAYVVIGGVT